MKEGRTCVPEDIHREQIVSVRPEPICDGRVETLKTIELADGGLEDAKIIFVAGRAFRSKAETGPISDAARALDAEVGATRPPVQDGLLPPERLIGITGASVSPKLLVAMGLSGSAPFMQGAQGAEKIYAFNEEPDAPIFRVADVGMVVDCKKVISELNCRLNER
jgi:electron transfer flavoprotein alpha subunit